MTPDAIVWRAPERMPTLGADDVHVWAAALDQPEGKALSLSRWLSPEEEFRARQYAFERDRQRFILCRGMLRQLLAAYVERPPETLAFLLGPEGKPRLAGESPWRFNVAHSDSLAVFAVARGRELGVDLERLRPLHEVGAITEQFFSAREQQTLAHLPESQQLEAFFHCWTRKEAVLKARGVGLTEPLDRIDVTLTPGEPARLLAIADEPAGAARWSLVELSPAEGFIGALAVEGAPFTLTCFAWPV